MVGLELKSVYKRVKDWKISANKRKAQLFRFIEYKRLKRIRNYKSPQYSYCKNCGEKLLGMYCHKCGQYALNVDQNFLMYIRQFFENAYQFDGKVLQTVYNLIIRPGFLSKEFIAGKINSYVHPLKLYMFASIIFFSFILVIYSGDRYADQLVEIVTDINTQAAESDSIQKIQSDKKMIAISDTFRFSSDTLKYQLKHQLKDQLKDQLKLNKDPLSSDSSERLSNILTSGTTNDITSWREKVKGLYKDMFDQSSQKLPFLLLALLPVFAYLLRVLFRKTHRAYMSNFVFSVHIHTMLLFMFIVAILLNIWTGIASIYSWMLVLFGIYVFLAIRNFYHNNWVKTILKTIIVSSLYTFIFIIAISILLVITIVGVSENY